MISSVMKRLLLGASVMLLASTRIAVAAPIDDARDLVDSIAATGHAQEAADLQKVVDTMSDSELEVFTTSGIMKMRDGLDAYRKAVEAANAIGWTVPTSRSKTGGDGRAATRGFTLPSDFPDGNYPDNPPCLNSPNTADWDTLVAVRATFFVAQEALLLATQAADVATNFCNLIIVGIGVGSNPQQGVCIGLEIALGVAEVIVETARGAAELVDFCDDGVDFARLDGVYQRLEYLHDHLDRHDTEIKTQLDTHDEEVQQLLDEVLERLATIEGKVDFLLQSQLEIAMSERGFARPSVYYEERLDELCELAQASIEELPRVYLVAEKARTLVADGMSLKTTDPKLAADTCIQGYVLATLGSGKLH